MMSEKITQKHPDSTIEQVFETLIFDQLPIILYKSLVRGFSMIDISLGFLFRIYVAMNQTSFNFWKPIS